MLAARIIRRKWPLSKENRVTEALKRVERADSVEPLWILMMKPCE
jgi:hypothetical protein